MKRAKVFGMAAILAVMLLAGWASQGYTWDGGRDGRRSSYHADQRYERNKHKYSGRHASYRHYRRGHDAYQHKGWWRHHRADRPRYNPYHRGW